jgi:hypothetical protein
MSFGGLAVKVNGPVIVSKSWVPIATRDLFLKIHETNIFTCMMNMTLGQLD